MPRGGITFLKGFPGIRSTYLVHNHKLVQLNPCFIDRIDFVSQSSFSISDERRRTSRNAVHKRKKSPTVKKGDKLSRPQAARLLAINADEENVDLQRSLLRCKPGMNRCDISEEETTKALHGLYQMRPSEGINKLQNHANGTTSAVLAVDVLHLDQNL